MASIIGSVVSHSLTCTCICERLNQVGDICAGKKYAWFLLSVCLDIYLGWQLHVHLLEYAGHHNLCSQDLIDTVVHSHETTVHYLKQLLLWLTENPVGLKLNSVLSRALGKFFMYHVHLWVTYANLVVPLIAAHAPTISSVAPYAPISLKMAVAGDILSLLFLHVNCFYAYAKRLTQCQWQGCFQLGRLFAGKKYNPLRRRIDSADASVEQLFLGTVVFAILLFLLPTSLTFLMVFSCLRLVFVVAKSVLRYVILKLEYVPRKSS